MIQGIHPSVRRVFSIPINLRKGRNTSFILLSRYPFAGQGRLTRCDHIAQCTIDIPDWCLSASSWWLLIVTVTTIKGCTVVHRGSRRASREISGALSRDDRLTSARPGRGAFDTKWEKRPTWFCVWSRANRPTDSSTYHPTTAKRHPRYVQGVPQMFNDWDVRETRYKTRRLLNNYNILGIKRLL